MLKIFLILTPINRSIWPIKLSYTFHTSLLPLPIIRLAIKPCVYPLPVELIIFEFTFVVLKKFGFAVMLNNKILVFSHRFAQFRRYPLEINKCLSQSSLECLTFLEKLLDNFNFVSRVFLFVLQSYFCLLVDTLTLISPIN